MINEDLRRWFKEKWVDISKKTKGGKHPPCGRSKATDAKYPKCRPSVRVSSKTPQTSGEMTQKDKKRAVRQKRSAEAKVSTTTQGRKPVMTSHKKLNEESCGCEHSKAKKLTKFMKKIKEETEVTDKFSCPFEKTFIENIDNGCLNKKSVVQYISESDTEIKYAKGIVRIASNKGLKEGYDLEIVGKKEITPVKFEDILSMKYFDDDGIKEYSIITEANKPTNPSLWSKAKSLAKQKFKVYPSAYANGWAAKWYKKHGGGWKSVNEEVQVNEEIVNAAHAGTMTKRELKSRDRIAKKVKAKPIKGKDTAENAKYRLATFIQLKKRGQEPKGKKEKKK